MDDCKILIVDDDEDIRECLRDVLEFEGYSVVGAEDGKAALKILEEDHVRPNLILLDLMMPVMNASEFMQIKKQSEELSAIPSIIMSASSLSEERIKELQVEGHINKPFDIKDLIGTVKRFCA